jgi:hypothetical protein
MDLKTLKYELQNIITGNDTEGQSHLIKAVQTHLKSGSSSGTKIETKFNTRAEEERALTGFADSKNLWVKENDIGNYITEGAEQKVYFPVNESFVIKVADAIFYTSWLEYFNNLLLHNSFFPNTAYELIGFLRRKEKFYAVVKQPFIIISEMTNLTSIRSFLEANGFVLKKNNDYYHPNLGIILEDLHDENVLTNSGVLFFVDTVFYITDDFYK